MGAITRRRLLKQVSAMAAMTAMGGGLDWAVARAAEPIRPLEGDHSYRFVQISDTHLGYHGEANRHVEQTLSMTLNVIRQLNPLPDFLVVTGDLTEATESAVERTARMKRFRAMIEDTRIPYYLLPGEHDALLDQGQTYRKILGPLFYSFVYRQTKFIALDNVSKGFFLGRGQIQWLARTLADHNPAQPVVVLSHAPLYDAFLPWNWYTFDGSEAFGLLNRFPNVHALFGHTHQLMSHQQGSVKNIGGLPTSWPLPQAEELTRLQPWPQSATNPYMGLGFRIFDVNGSGGFRVTSGMLSKDSKPMPILGGSTP